MLSREEIKSNFYVSYGFVKRQQLTLDWELKAVSSSCSYGKRLSVPKGLIDQLHKWGKWWEEGGAEELRVMQDQELRMTLTLAEHQWQRAGMCLYFLNPSLSLKTFMHIPVALLRDSTFFPQPPKICCLMKRIRMIFLPFELQILPQTICC